MSKRRKRLERMKNNPRTVSFDELRAILDDYGFEMMRSSGSHFTFKVMINGQWVSLVIPFARPIKHNYVKEAIRLIEEVSAESEATDDDN
jgi:predicted RNA binding protein YcfA (HicA-like mRNA interferase family)